MNKTTKRIHFLPALNKYIFIFLLMCSASVFAQREAAIWYYGGKGGLDFNTGKPVFLADGQLEGGEGCASVSDKQGKLLFYTDGLKVYNRNHGVMPNGSSLLGSGSSSQSAIIIQKPGTTNKYYVFTVADQEGEGKKGFNYYEIDLSLDGGLGDVALINNGDLGLPSTPIATPVTEKLTAIAHADGKQTWVICHSANGNNNYLAYLVSATGVSTTPVVSSIGFVTDYVFGIPNNCVGYLKVSPNGKKIAAATYGVPQSPLAVGLELFDFNTSTGIISNRQVLNSLSNYGVEFSINNKVLYATNSTGNPNQIVQYDITLPTETAIKQSEVIIPSVRNVFGLQLAIDGKIYVARGGNQGAQGAINNPNILGLGCDYKPDAIFSGSASPGEGLPNFIPSLFEEKINFDGLCAGSPTTLTINPYIDIVNPSWNFGDPTSGSNTSTQIIPAHTYTKEGTYTVNVVFFNSAGLKIEITSDVTIFAAVNATKPSDINVCDTGNGTAVFDVTPQTTIILGSQATADFTVTYYTTQADADAGTNAVTGNLAAYTSAGETIYTRVQNNISGCYAVTSFDLIVAPLPVVAQIPTVNTCDTGAVDGLATFNLTAQEAALVNGQTGVNVTYFTTQADADANTNAIATPANFTNTVNPQTIYVRLNGALCFNTTSFNVETLDVPALADDLSIEGCSPFNLTAVIAEIGTDFTLGYYTSEADAIADINAITAPTVYPLTGNEGTVYIRAENSNGCFSVAPLTLVTGACEIQRGISPGDGEYNNTFDLTNFNVTKISIFNRYGKEVYSKNNYKNEWGGQASNGDELPTGTYFYTFSSPTTGNKTGWIYINRRS